MHTKHSVCTYSHRHWASFSKSKIENEIGTNLWNDNEVHMRSKVFGWCGENSRMLWKSQRFRFADKRFNIYVEFTRREMRISLNFKNARKSLTAEWKYIYSKIYYLEFPELGPFSIPWYFHKCRWMIVRTYLNTHIM